MNSKKIIKIIGLVLLTIITLLYIFSGRIEEYLLNQSGLKESSLILFSFLIGMLDGFNPCAMWVLIYLITLVSQLQDKKKMWFIVGTFLLASGVIYFLILALWLNGWDYVGYLVGAGWILTLAGVFAFVSGIYFLYEFYKSGGELVCKVGDMKQRQKTMTKIKSIVLQPMTITTFLALVALAFAINLTEFVCSIGLPALFTQVVSSANLSVFQDYFLLGVYTFAFMLDDLIVFYFGLKATQSPIFEKYSGATKLIGGVIMILLGAILLFFPEFLL